MEVIESEAAITAINALQKRVKELELEKQALSDDVYSLNLQIRMKDDHFTQRQQELIDATKRAKQMINNAASTMMDIKSERDKNQELKTRIALTEETLGGNHVRDDSLVMKLGTMKRIQRNIDHYEMLLADIFSAPWQSIAANYLSLADARNINTDPDLLPQPVREIVHRLCQLPQKCKGQDIVARRAIVQGLICSLETAGELSAKIHALERQRNQSKTPLRIGIEIHSVAVQLFVLTRAINRFRFG